MIIIFQIINGISKIKLKIIIIFLFISNYKNKTNQFDYKRNDNIKIALCTMGREENLYAEEFIEYYINLGINHLFIYDDNENNTEKINDVIDKKYQKYLTIYETKRFNIDNQTAAFTECYNNHMKDFDWFLMVDMDEYLFIVNDTLKGYLLNKRFNKCDFIKINWVIATDNNLIYYDPRSLFERFKPPYIKSEFVKSIIRGNISGLKYWVHTPYISPYKNITCNNVGRRIYYKKMNFIRINPINIRKAYIIHFEHKSTEELIKKIKRGYKNWLKSYKEKFIIEKIKFYLKINKASPEKVNYIEKELKLNLTEYIKNKNSGHNFIYFLRHILNLFN